MKTETTEELAQTIQDAVYFINRQKNEMIKIRYVLNWEIEKNGNYHLNIVTYEV